MGRVGRVMERRTLRRAAEQTLLRSEFERPGLSMFAPRAQPRHRKVPVVFTLAAAAAAVLVLGVLLMVRTPTAGIDESTTVSPTMSTSDKPTPSSQPVPRSDQPTPPVAAPAPPPVAAATINPPPVVTRQPLGPAETPAAREPEIGVTRTPVTRAPMSVAPEPRTPPTAADDGHKRGPRGPFGCC